MNKLLNVKELSEYLNVSTGWIYDACSKGILPHFRIGSNLRFKIDEVEKFLAENHFSSPKEDWDDI